MNDLTPINQSGALTTAAPNNFEAYSEAANGNRIIGDLIKYSKGDWLRGRNSDEMPKGTRLIANVADLKIGWVKWSGGRPADVEMGRVADGYRMPKRDELGDTDESLWEVDEQTGKPRDPWQLTNNLVLKAEKSDELFSFSPSSKGGVGAIAKLVGEYGKRIRMHPNDLPIVALDSDSYQHPNRALGRIKTPVLKIVGWTSNAGFADALAAEAAEAEEMSEVPFEDAPAAAVTATGRARKPASAEF